MYMKPRLTAINLTTEHQTIKPSANVTLVVGPNNVGKSAVLANIQQELHADFDHPPTIGDRPVESVTIEMPTGDSLAELVSQRAKLWPAGKHSHSTYYEPTYHFWSGATLPEARLRSITTPTSRLGPLASAVMTYLGPDGRGSVLNSQGLPDLMTSQARSPLQMLWENRELEEKINTYMQRAFGQSITVNRHAGANIHLHIGKIDLAEPKIGVRTEYQDAVMDLPLLSQQGSGMQAFIGTMITLATGNFDIVLLDEPETFLHPPQARLLGEIVAEFSHNGGPQVIVATHSDDFVQGVISASRDEADISIVRLTRPNISENKTAQVDTEAIKNLYRDPLLRYSNILDGIFYKGVVLCEAESDCTYYAATLGYLEEKDGLGSSDILFTQCGGKDRLRKAFSSLDVAAVPTAIIADIDILADKNKFQELFNSMGGDFETINASYNVLESSVKNKTIKPERKIAKIKINDTINASSAKYLSGNELAAVQDAVKAASGWKQIKEKGQGAIDSGDPSAAFVSILAACRAVGLFIVEQGELERFHPEISGNKQAWLRKVLEQEAFKSSPESHILLSQARDYILRSQ